MLFYIRLQAFRPHKCIPVGKYEATTSRQFTQRNCHKTYELFNVYTYMVESQNVCYKTNILIECLKSRYVKVKNDKCYESLHTYITNRKPSQNINERLALLCVISFMSIQLNMYSKMVSQTQLCNQGSKYWKIPPPPGGREILADVI